jgi:hypothetical protein
MMWISNVLCAVGVAYLANFAGATLALGRAISIAGTKTGYQDAVTPPWVGYFSCLIYGASIMVIIASWSMFGVLRGCISVAVLLAGIVAFGQLVPKSDSLHFKVLIIQSMTNRYANYVRDNDKLRAAIMKELLEKLGVPVDRLAAVSSPAT